MDSAFDIVRIVSAEGENRLFQLIQNGFSNTGSASEALHEMIVSGTSFYLVLGAKREAVGFYSLQERDPEHLVIRDFCFSADRAAAEFSLDYLNGQARDAGYPEVWIGVPVEDTKKSGFFLERGFKRSCMNTDDSAVLEWLRRKLQ